MALTMQSSSRQASLLLKNLVLSRLIYFKKCSLTKDCERYRQSILCVTLTFPELQTSFPIICPRMNYLCSLIVMTQNTIFSDSCQGSCKHRFWLLWRKEISDLCQTKACQQYRFQGQVLFLWEMHLT
jgi:hypothetical protein